MSKFFLLLGLVSQLAVAVAGIGEIKVINCHTNGIYMFCEELGYHNKKKEGIEKIKEFLMQDAEQYNNPSIVAINEDGEKPTYCILNNASSAKKAIQVVLNSSIIGCKYAGILTVDSNNDIQYDVIISLKIDHKDNEFNLMFNEERFPAEEDTSNICYLCEKCSQNFYTLNALNEHKIKCKKRKHTESDDNEILQKKKKTTRKSFQCDYKDCHYSTTTSSHLK
ncbi:MAG: hypothetical protein PUP46_10515, partial [Endozoicomonas sp. (ex Botrylloides leachii)]|nr:hypothetical protein [Endozoicomonas sp. (ex Botrylloides leachii)]